MTTPAEKPATRDEQEIENEQMKAELKRLKMPAPLVPHALN